MAFPVRTCALVGRFSDPRIAESVGALLPHLTGRGVTVLVSEDAPLGSGLAVRVPEEEFGRRADLVIAVGGDGTLLYALRLVVRHGVPLLGVNRGRVGFLTDVMPQDMLGSVDAALAGELQADERPLLEARLHCAGGDSGASLRAQRCRHAKARHRTDARFRDPHRRTVTSMRTAGMASSSPPPPARPPTHSPAAARSSSRTCPRSSSLPICPHTLSDRPIVISSSSVIEVALIERPDTQAHVICDGAVLGQFTAEDRLEVRTAAERATLLHPPGHDYYALLRSKLHWGRGRFED